MIPLSIIASSRPNAPEVGWTPAQLPGLVGWWDPADATRSGGLITGIVDKSATANHLTQSNPALYPAASILSGLPAMTFSNIQLLTPTSTINLGTSCTILIVAAASAIGYYLVELGVDDLSLISGYNSRAFELYQSRTGTMRFTVANTVTAGCNMVGFSRSNTSVTGRLNGVSAGSGTFSTESLNFSQVGNRFTKSGTSGAMGETIVTTPALSASDLAKAENYLRTKWSTP